MKSDDAPARNLLELGRSFRDRGHPTESRALLDAARVTARVLGDERTEAEAWSEYGQALVFVCEPDESRSVFDQARAMFDAIGDRDQVVLSKLRVAFSAYDGGDLERAAHVLDEVEEDLSSSRAPRAGYVGRLRGHRGNIARSRGDHATARTEYLAAIDALEGAGGDALFASVFRMDLAIVELLDGELETAIGLLARVRDWSASLGRRGFLEAMVNHYLSLAALLLGDESLAPSESGPVESVAFTFLRQARAALRERQGLARALERLESECPPFEHGRLTLQIIRRSDNTPTSAARRLIWREPSRVLRVDDGEEISLASHPALARLVAALIAARERPDAPILTVDELIEAAWPGERIELRAARNRFHVALATLRRFGLRNIIVRSAQGGYAIAPAIRVVRA